MKNMKNNKKKFIILGIIVMVVIISIAAIKIAMLKKSESEVKSMETITVPTHKKIFIDGTVLPRDREYVYYDQTMGEVDSVKVEDGNEVQKDDVLFVYNNTQVTNEIKSLELQKNKLVKSKALAQKSIDEAKKNAALSPEQSVGMINTNEIDNITVEIGSLDEQLKGLKEKQFKEVLAPCSGVISIGKIPSTPGEPYMTIQSTDFYIDGLVSEKDYGKIEVEKGVNINVLATKDTLEGTIYYKDSNPQASNVGVPTNGVTGSAQGGNQLSYYNVKITPSNQDKLVNGYHVQCVLELLDSKIKIPTESIIEVDNEKVVFVVEDNTLKKVKVEVDGEEDSDSIINSGLQGGEKIIKVPTLTMKEGDKVE